MIIHTHIETHYTYDLRKKVKKKKEGLEKRGNRTKEKKNKREEE